MLFIVKDLTLSTVKVVIFSSNRCRDTFFEAILVVFTMSDIVNTVYLNFLFERSFDIVCRMTVQIKSLARI